MRLSEEAWAAIRAAWEGTEEPATRLGARFKVSTTTIYTRARRELWSARPRGSAVGPLQSGSPTAARLAGCDAEVPDSIVAASETSPASDRGPKSAGPVTAGMADRSGSPPRKKRGASGVARKPEAGSVPHAQDSDLGADTPQERGRRLLRLIDLQLASLERTMTTTEPQTAQEQERTARAITALANQAAAISDALESKVGQRDTGRDGSRDDAAEADRLRHEIAERIEKLNAKWLAEKDPE